MQFAISVLVLVATFIQMLCSAIDLRTARAEGARWMGAEDDLVHEHRWWRQRRVRRELRSWRSPNIHRDIVFINLVLVSWMMLFVAAAIGLVTAPLPRS